jgi:hypothetical protein
MRKVIAVLIVLLLLVELGTFIQLFCLMLHR